MDNHLLPMDNCFSSQIELIGFAPMETKNSIHKEYDGSSFLVLDSKWPFSNLSILFIGTD